MNTICAPSTASGGAIGIIRVSGSDAVAIVDSIFSKTIINAPANKAIYGTIKSTDDGCIVDDVVITIFRAPHSYTGDDTVEISHHGSQYIQHTILLLLIANGCTMAQPGEFTKRAYMNGKMDLSQAEAVADVIASNDAASHRIAIQQMRGSISTKLHQLRDKLLELTSLLELELDFSDHEDLEFADRTQLLSIANSIEQEISNLSNSFSLGNAIKNGIPVAIIGAPNVGKSTLLNLLIGEERAIVSDIQGTTRDIIEDTINIQGHTFRFIDTAGIRHTEDIIEQMGIERSIKAADNAHVIILLTEPGVPFPDINPHENQHVLRVTNKCDISASSDDSIHISAKRAIGIDKLQDALLSTIPLTSPSDIIINNIRHKQALDLAHKDILRAIDALTKNLSGDLIAEDLRQCLSTLAEILGGQITPTEVLSNIFKHFCIGK